MTPEEHIAKTVYERARREDRLVLDTLEIYHRPCPRGLGLGDGPYLEYDRYIAKLRKGACPLCDTLVGHAPKCEVVIAIQKSKNGMEF